ncbi:hypothetical protein G6F29_014400 [Rhizopus arrhizus]|nr:hypothetical protein G6F29_014400 [Rhizopus arrhizus]KAG0975693.1 hypothetical protein G6F27_014373 [Rhizopus arrhizus]KAG1000840.1 hypothetical protein G6F26_014309 [Rhizopus arrhizus]KAG1003411.1 hypothetical protein G6F25_014428 [Rhizopus arrhizus]KAG1047803.1 hypothetical protein G6F41_014406 [Rhizopus arrhizus]
MAITLRTPGDRRETKEGAERPDLTKGTPRYTKSSTIGRGVSYNWRRSDEDGREEEEEDDGGWLSTAHFDGFHR